MSSYDGDQAAPLAWTPYPPDRILSSLTRIASRFGPRGARRYSFSACHRSAGVGSPFGGIGTPGGGAGGAAPLVGAAACGAGAAGAAVLRRYGARAGGGVAAAGAAGFSVLLFTVAVTASRSIRFLVIALLVMIVGQRAEDLLKKYDVEIFVGGLLLFAGFATYLVFFN